MHWGFFFIFSCLSQVLAEFPSDQVPQCNIGDTDCIMDRINNDVFQKLTSGLEELGLASIDPLQSDDLKILQEGPVRIQLYFHEVNFIGFSKGNLRELEGFGSEIDGAKLSFDLICPVINLLANYKVNGQILALPIQGEGKSNLTFVKPVIKFRAMTRKIVVDGEEYMEIDKARASIDVSRFIAQFSNLFNGNKELSRSLHDFIDENWQEIFTETKGSIEKAFVAVAKNYINTVFKKMPYRSFFLN